jgi:hypothetical protein
MQQGVSKVGIGHIRFWRTRALPGLTSTAPKGLQEHTMGYGLRVMQQATSAGAVMHWVDKIKPPAAASNSVVHSICPVAFRACT